MALTATLQDTHRHHPERCGPIKAYTLDMTTAGDLVVMTPSEGFSICLKRLYVSDGTGTTMEVKSRSPELAGTVATTNGSPTVTGTDTTFETDYVAGQEIVIEDGNTLTVQEVVSDTEITATGNASSTVSEKAHQRQKTYMAPELAANQGIWDSSSKHSYVLCTETNGALVLNSSGAVNNVFLHIFEGVVSV